MPKNIYGPDERAANGVIVSALVDGEAVTLHRVGRPTEALRAAIEDLEARGTVVVQAISTPQSIYADLQGRGHLDRAHGPEGETTLKHTFPEPPQLGKIGKRHLLNWEPRPIHGGSARSGGRI